MFAVPPHVEASPPAIAAEQQADFDCLRIAIVLGKPGGGDGGVSPWGARLFRAYLHRLEHADADRDWVATARGRPPMSYGWFLQTLQTCTTPLRSRIIVRPTQAAPPSAPAPTGG